MLRPTFAKFFRNLFDRKTKTISRRAATRKLHLEALEDRALPAVSLLGASTTQAQTSLGTTATLSSVTVPAGEDRLLVVSNAAFGNASAVTSITFGGVPLTQEILAYQQAGSASVWYLALGTSLTPTTGDVFVQYDQSAYRFATVTAFSGVNQADPMPNSNSRSAHDFTSDPTTITVPSAPGNLVLDVIEGGQSDTRTPGSGQTEQADVNIDIDQNFVHNGGGVSTKPGAATTTMTWTDQPLGFAGIAHVAVDIQSSSGLDFGDAPAGYPTTLAENGASHDNLGPTLGATRDTETNGTHSAEASADGADEDGVTAAGPLVVGQTTNITMNVQGGTGFVNAWADLNRDGDWDDDGERFLTNLPVAVGDNVIPFTVPSGFTPGQIVVRYRLTSAEVDSPSPTGFLPDGEVEDYVSTIQEAPSLVVTTAQDVVDNADGLTSLREAVDFANANPGHDEITFATALNGITLNIAEGEMSIDESVTITGNGLQQTNLDAGGSSIFFDIDSSSGDVTLRNMTMRSGSNGSVSGAIDFDSTATLTISNVAFYDNHGEETGGAIDAFQGTVVVRNSTFAGNHSNDEGGAIHARNVVVIDSTFDNNSADDDGGAIYATGSVVIAGSTFSGNTSGGFGSGGAVAAVGESLFVRDSIFFRNQTNQHGGAIFGKSEVASLVNSSFRGNSADQGGAIYLLADAESIDVSIIQSTIVGNSSAHSGGGVQARDANIVVQNSIIALNQGEEEIADDLGLSGTSSLNMTRSFLGTSMGTGLAETGLAAPDANGNFIGGVEGGPIDPLLRNVENDGYGPLVPEAGSPVVNVGDNSLAEYPGDDLLPGTNDANETSIANDVGGAGSPRIIGASVDMGAYEYPEYDFGDAPVGYPVTFEEDGARHIATGPTLGATRDAEPDGINSAAADADGADEDGISGEPLVVGQTSNLTFHIQGGSGYLNAWLDLNRDGDFDDMGEQFFVNLPVQVGDNVVPFPIPAEFVAGKYVVRVRLTSQSVDSPSPRGLLPDGEVEDYISTVQEAPSLVVTTAQDVVDNADGLTSLREAVAFANATPGAEVITFAAALNGTPIVVSQQIQITSGLTIQGNGRDETILDGQQASRILLIDSASANVLLQRMTLRNARAAGTDVLGGAISSRSNGKLFIEDSTFSGNSVPSPDSSGGAISAKNVDIRGSIFTNNSATWSGGALYVPRGGSAVISNNTFSGNHSTGAAGAIAIRDSSLHIANSTFEGNTSAYQGGAIYGTIDQSVVIAVVIVNSTFSGNTSNGDGGAIYVDQFDESSSLFPLTIIQSTIAGNHSEVSGGGVEARNATVVLRNSIIAGNSTDEFGPEDLRVVGFGASLDARNSLIGTSGESGLAETGIGAPDSNGNYVGGESGGAIDPLLGPLQDNGGPTFTRALLAGSKAINNGSNAFAQDPGNDGIAVTNDANEGALANDQRGPDFIRIVGGAADMGAFESDTAPLAYDFGDAPAGYPVTLAENGARHVATGLTLGATRDSESDGTHSANASADGADDGVTAAGPLVVGQTTNITMNVQGGTGFINAWADLNRDGDWDDQGEQFLVNFPANVGDNTIPFTVPAFFTPGQIVVRYRLTSAAVDSPTPAGALPDGEVEDYASTIHEAPSLVVTTNQDVVNDMDGLTSLREAIAFAEATNGVQSITFGNGAAAGGTDFTDNTADRIDLVHGNFDITTGVVITGPGAPLLTIDANGEQHFAVFGTNAQLTLSGVTLTGGDALDWDGGAIIASAPIVLQDCVFDGNAANQGGALSLSSTATIIRCVFINNSAADDGGAIRSESGSILIVRDSTFARNRSEDEGGVIDNNGTAYFVNSTIAYNSARNDGGGINNQGTLYVVNSTIARNTAGAQGDDGEGTGGIRTDDDRGLLYLFNSIVAGNFFESEGSSSPSDLSPGSAGVDASSTGNLIGNASTAGGLSDGVNGNIVGVLASQIFVTDSEGEPLLADNGGSTQTIALRTGSRAIDNGDASHATEDGQIGSTSLVNDQRGAGFSRNVGGSVDIGAFESQIPYDFGDAPAGYPVTLAENGARHVATGPTLGDTRDSESDGTHSADAGADGADEDGVSAAGPLYVGQSTDITISVRNGDGYVSAWADLNRDGDWDDDGERFLTNAYGDGDLVIPFAIPEGFMPGPVAVRYRLTSDPVESPNPTGEAPDGEVEDYIALIQETPSLVVTTNQDVVDPTDRLTSLREAIAYAATKPGDDIITFGNGSAIPGGTDFTDAMADTIVPQEYSGRFDLESNVAIHAPGSARLTIIEGFFIANGTTAELTGLTISGGVAELGGAIRNNGNLTVRNSTIVGNRAAFGGAIQTQGTLLLSQVTISGNTASNMGGGIEVDGGTVLISQSTIVNNSTGINTYAGSVTIVNSIIANLGSDFTGNNVASATNTLVGNPQSAGGIVHGINGNIVGMEGDADDRSLLPIQDIVNPLADNGGTTQTHTLASGSVAINAGSNALATANGQVGGTALTTDQRGAGFPRINGGTVDIGAVESASPGFDFGDAPAGYPVTLEENGARHVAIGPRLGATRGTQADGVHSPTATADPADDGLSAASPFIVGQTSLLTINVQGGSGYINAWTDVNRDGDWDDEGEQSLANFPVQEGDNVIPIPIPANFTPGVFFGRYRLTSAPVESPSPYGELPDGEVEDYLAPVFAADFGDAPAGYPVTLEENGARHLATGPTLGATRDAEADGTHSPNATADGADEDGVTASGPLVAGQTTNITINVQGGSGFVNAWADLNRDGDWNDLGEQFLVNLPVQVGANTIPFAVPANFAPGNVSVRYRLTSASVESPTPTGLLPDGEVEDYTTMILTADNHYYVDSRGVLEYWLGNEKWLRGDVNAYGNTWYYVLPNGDLFAWSGAGLSGVKLASFGPEAWDDPEIIVRVATHAATNPAEVAAADQARAFFRASSGNFYQNAFGAGEKWIEGLRSAKSLANRNNAWYYILPNGSVFEWSGYGLTGTQVASITPDENLYRDPSRLTDAFQSETVDSGGFDATRNFQFDRFGGLVRNLWENWGGTEEKWFRGDINAFDNPWYFVRTNGDLIEWNGSFGANGNLLAHLGADAWNNIESVVHDASAELPYYESQQLAELDQQYRLFRASNDVDFYANSTSEARWLAGKVNSYGNIWYFVRPNGDLVEWNGFGRNGSLIASIQAADAVFSDPLLLADAFQDGGVLDDPFGV